MNEHRSQCVCVLLLLCVNSIHWIMTTLKEEVIHIFSLSITQCTSVQKYGCMGPRGSEEVMNDWTEREVCVCGRGGWVG